MSARPSTFLLLTVICTPVHAIDHEVAAQVAEPSARTTYTLTIDAYDKRSVHVRAHLLLTDTLILMYPEGADHVPQGWSSFVRDLVATDDRGAIVPLRSRGNGQWVIPSPAPKALNLQYTILVHHDAGPWPFGSKEAAFARNDCVFLTGKALFIAQYETRDALVEFVLPRSWKIATPWADVVSEGAKPDSDADPAGGR